MNGHLSAFHIDKGETFSGEVGELLFLIGSVLVSILYQISSNWSVYYSFIAYIVTFWLVRIQHLWYVAKK